MEKYKVIQYQSDYYSDWNDFVALSKNATFLFHRDFMEYHKDRFQDFSLIVLDEKDKIKALLPANVNEKELFSHQGLSYGGVLIDNNLKLDKFILIFQSILNFLNQNGIQKLHLKLLPNLYHSFPAEEINYVLFLTKAECFRTDTTATIDLRLPVKIDGNRFEGVKRAKTLTTEIKKETNFAVFWNEVLIPNLKEKHQALPVHTLEEIEKLHRMFPENIVQYNCYQEGNIVAGTTLFINDNVVHVQYISGIGNKNQNGALDYLFFELITQIYKDYTYFDFGISNEMNGTKLNLGLHYWKQSFGARTFVHDFYSIDTQNYIKLSDVLI